MRILIISLACYNLLCAACGSSSKQPGHTDSSTVAQRRLSDKIMAIAAAIPLTKDSASVFFSTLFQPADSLQITTNQYFQRFFGKTLHLVIDKDEDTIKEVRIWLVEGRSLPVRLQELADKMDSAWQELPMGPFPMKDPILAVVGYYTDPQHIRKQLIVFGPDYNNMTATPDIREIRISIEE